MRTTRHEGVEPWDDRLAAQGKAVATGPRTTIVG